MTRLFTSGFEGDLAAVGFVAPPPIQQPSVVHSGSEAAVIVSVADPIIAKMLDGSGTAPVQWVLGRTYFIRVFFYCTAWPDTLPLNILEFGGTLRCLLLLSLTGRCRRGEAQGLRQATRLPG